MFRKTVIAGLSAAVLAPALGLAQQPAAPGTSPGSSAASAPAAPAAPSVHTLTGNIGIFSQYIFRGLTQTDRDPALQGGFDYAHASGLYAGTWASNISLLRDAGLYSRGGSLEWDFYGGYKGNFGKSDFTFDVGTLYYYYPGSANTGANPLNIKANTWEVYGGVGWKWLTAKYSYSISNRTFGVRDSRGTWYLDLSANVPLGDFVKPLDGFTLMAHWGKQDYDGNDARIAPMNNDSVYSYEDWKLGLSYTLPQNFTVGAFYTDTSGTTSLGYGTAGGYPRNIGRGTGTVYVQKTF